MKTEEILILGLTGAAAYLVWRMQSQKPAMVTQSITAPVTRSPVSTAVVPVGSQQPSLPTMQAPRLPEPAAPRIVSVGTDETAHDALVKIGITSRCIPKNIQFQYSPCPAGYQRELLPGTLDYPICGANEKDGQVGIGKCKSVSNAIAEEIKKFKADGFVDVDWISPADTQGGTIVFSRIPDAGVRYETEQLKSLKMDPRRCFLESSPPPIRIKLNAAGNAKHGGKQTIMRSFSNTMRGELYTMNTGPRLKSILTQRRAFCASVDLSKYPGIAAQPKGVMPYNPTPNVLPPITR